MKLVINYDLLDKVTAAKKGIILKQIPIRVLQNMSFYAPLVIGIDLVCNMPEEIVQDLLWGLSGYAIYNSAKEFFLSPVSKSLAQDELEILCSKLGLLNISTTPENLLQSKKYNTEYELIEKSENGIRKIQTNKYILIPTINQEEVSILQEHIVGTDTYSLSIGEPKKAYKLSLASNPV